GLGAQSVVNGDGGGHRAHGEVAVAEGELAERRAPTRPLDGPAGLDQQLVLGQRGGEVVDEEVVGRHDAALPCSGRGQDHLGAEGEGGAGQFGGGVGGGQAA